MEIFYHIFLDHCFKQVAQISLVLSFNTSDSCSDSSCYDWFDIWTSSLVNYPHLWTLDMWNQHTPKKNYLSIKNQTTSYHYLHAWIDFKLLHCIYTGLYLLVPLTYICGHLLNINKIILSYNFYKKLLNSPYYQDVFLCHY